jgi:hypothetical protein
MIAAQDLRAQAQAAWVEHQILGHLKQALRVTLNWKAPSFSQARKMSSVQFTMKSFQRHLTRMMDLEEQDGYMSAVLERDPNSGPRILRLEREHRQFRQMLDELDPDVAAMTSFDDDQFEAACSRIGDLLDRVDRHDVNEIELLQESMLCDAGGEG